MPGLLLPTSSKSTSKAADAWSFSFRGGYESDSSASEGGEGEDNTEGGGESRCLAQLTDDAKLMKELDIASRAEAAQFKANPWSIARVNAASRNTDSNAEDATCSASKNDLAQEDTCSGNAKTHEGINKQSKLSSSTGQMTIAVPAGRSSAPLGRLKKPALTGKAKPSSTIQRFFVAASDAVVRDGRNLKDVSSKPRSITSDARRPFASPATIDRSDSTKPSKFSHASDHSSTPTTINDIDPGSIAADPGRDSSMTKEIARPDTLLICDDTTTSTGGLTKYHAFSDDPGLNYSDNSGDLQYGGRNESIASGPVTLFVGPGLDSNRPTYTTSSANTQGGPEIASGAWLIQLMDE